METRWFDPIKKVTLTGRKKEDKIDYRSSYSFSPHRSLLMIFRRFFPEPDLPPLVITDDDIQRMASSLPELPDDTLKRISEQYGIEVSPPTFALPLTSTKPNDLDPPSTAHFHGRRRAKVL